MNEPNTSAAYNPYAPPTAYDPPPPAAIAVHLELASIGERFVAHLIDVAIVGGTLFAALLAWLAIASPQPTQDQLSLIVWICLIPGLLVQTVSQAALGRSLGKRFLGLKVVTLDDVPASFLRVVFARNVLPSTIGLACGLFSLVDAFSIFRESRRTLRDGMARTRVVRSR